MAIADIAGKSNVELWNLARKIDPTFASHTSEGTAELFTERGFESISRTNINALNEWFNISMRVAFQMLNVAGARNPLADSGLVEVFNTPNGGYVQRLAMDAIKPVTPAYSGLSDGDSVDPFVVRKPTIKERFYQQNFDFQNLITNQNFQTKTIFVSEYGMGQVLAGILEGLSVSYTKQEYYNTLECLNAAINSTNTPLQDSQVVRLSAWTDDAPTAAQLTEFIKIGKNIARHMESVASTSEYNASGFDTVVTPSDFIMLVRPNILTDMETLNALNAPQNQSIPFSVRAVEHFGGMIPMNIPSSGSAARVYPVYDPKLGTQIGWNTTQSAETATLQDNQIQWSDPNAEVLAVIAQRGVIFENAQNPFTVEPIRNPRGMYDNYFANRPGTAIVYDSYRGLIVIAKPVQD